MISQQEITDLISNARNAKKYRDLDLPASFLQDLIENEVSSAKNKRALKESFRKKLHEVVAPYLEDIDYSKETAFLFQQSGDKMESTDLKTWALEQMQKHSSTRERIPYLQSFYPTIWEKIGLPTSIIDLACALDPLALPWFGNPALSSFYAVDINKPRLKFLERFFELFFPFACTIHRDFIAEPVLQTADCAFLFKEVHRMEKRKPGCTRDLIQMLNVRHIVISLPATDLRGHHSLHDLHDKLIKNTVDKLGLSTSQTQVGTELIYFIEKP